MVIYDLGAAMGCRLRPRFNDPAELTAFYHSVASFGLKFQLGDSLYDLAVPRKGGPGRRWGCEV